MNRPKIYAISFLVMTLLLVPMTPSMAMQHEDIKYYSHHLSHEEMKKINQRFDLLSLDKLWHKIKKSDGDRILEVALLKYHDRLVYEIEILKTNGEVVILFRDAKTGIEIKKLLEE